MDVSEVMSKIVIATFSLSVAKDPACDFGRRIIPTYLSTSIADDFFIVCL